MDNHVPSLTGEAAELADVLIRIFHYCGRRGINLGEAVRLKHEYNITRPYKHGKNL
jgi:NTP pyrophosphatase (non-canonical NTP hydrolase)